MAVSSASEGGQTGVWWSSWLSSAREKSMNALNATKRDLAEFVSVIGTDTKEAVKDASVNINKILLPSLTTTNSAEKPSGSEQKVVEVEVQAPYDRCQAELFAVQNSSDTYLQDPLSQGEQSDFDEWKSAFDIQSYQGDISNLLVSCSHVRTKHSQLVPAKVSYETFWSRYFYRIEQLQKEEKRRADLMARAANRSQEQLQWDEEVDVIGNPLLLKTETSSHQRSESSTDSFVCVSEETGLEGERASSRDVAESESWEHVGGSESVGSGSHDSGGRVSEIEEKEGVKEVLDELLQKEQSPLECTDVEPDKGSKSGKEREGDGDSNSSDWENWDD